MFGFPTTPPPSSGSFPSRRAPWIGVPAAVLLGLLLALPAACASAQGASEPQPGAAPPPEGERISAPEGATAPGTPVRWVEGGLQSREAEPPVLVVRGQSQVEVEPDRARIAFAVETEAESARDAAQENARRMTEVMEAVRRAGEGLPGLRVETSGYALTPRYRTARETSLREIAGYTARNHVRVTVDEVTDLGRLMDAALEGGANRVANLQFLLQDPEPHREAALREAVRKARSEATIIADALGVRLGEPLQVDGGADVPGPRPFADFEMARAAMAMAEVPTPVEAGTLTVSANVTIRFRIESSP